MNFIRNIISEKRAARPEIASPPPAILAEALVGPDRRPDVSRHEADDAELNIFAPDADMPDADMVEDLGAPAPAEDDLFAVVQDTAFGEVEPQSGNWPEIDQPVPETLDERRFRHAEVADAGAIAAPRAPLVLGAGAVVHPGNEPTNQLNLNDMPFVSAAPVPQGDEMLTDAGLQMPPPAAGRGASRSGRVKTRLLGFSTDTLANPFERAESKANDPFPVGWLVVVAGPGRGAAFPLHGGVSRVGRGEDQTVCLNFGDNSISRENHISIAFDAEQNAFYVGQSGRSNIVRLNNKPLLSTEQVRSGDQIRVGETTLRLVALCGDDFSWTAKS